MRRGRKNGRRRVAGAPLSPRTRTPHAGFGVPTFVPEAPPNVLAFERTPPPAEGLWPGDPDGDADPWFESTPEPGSVTFPGEPEPELFQGPNWVPPAAGPVVFSPAADLPINERDNPGVLVPESTWQHARDLLWGADGAQFPVGRIIPMLNIKEGPGWVDLKSPNLAGVRFHIVGTDDLVGQRQVVTTGPAGMVSVWVGEFGTQVSVEALSDTRAYGSTGGTFPVPGFHVDQGTGRIFINDPVPEESARFQVRYHAAKRPTSGGGSIQSRSLNSMPLARVGVPMGTTFNLGYPPLNREIFVSHSPMPLVYGLAVGSPAGVIPVFTSASVTAITLDVPADTFVRVTHPAGGASRIFKAHWRDLAAVPQ